MSAWDILGTYQFQVPDPGSGDVEVASAARFFLPLHLHLLMLPQLKDAFFPPAIVLPLSLCPASLIFTSLLSTRVFPSEYKHAIISSIFKKISLDSHTSLQLLLNFSACFDTHGFHLLTSNSRPSLFQFKVGYC